MRLLMNYRGSNGRVWQENVGRWWILLPLFLLLTQPAIAQRQAQLPWWNRAAERKIGHYHIKTDLPADQANVIARHLNAMHDEYSKRLASLPQRSPTPMNVMIFANRNEYVQTLRTRYGVDGSGTGGIFFVNPSGSALALWTESLPQRRIINVVQHEGFHQFAYSRFGSDLPSWANEGLAEFFAESVLVNRSFIIGQSNPRVINAVKNAIELGTYIEFRKMLTMTQQQWSKTLHEGNASGQYHQAWSMVHFLVYGDNGRYVERFEAYLRAINAGFNSETAFIRAFETDDFQAFENRWKQYALAAKPSSFVTALERIEFLAEGALFLSRKGKSPQTLGELHESLSVLGFTYTVQKHGIQIELKGWEDEMYTIPMDTLATEQPVFVVTKPKRRGSSRRDRDFEETIPTPPEIATEHLEPKSLSIRWERDRETGEFSYEILVK